MHIKDNDFLKKKLFHPVIIGFILIALISSYFLWKTINEEHKNKSLEQRLADEKKEAGKVNVDLASAEEVYQWIGNKNVQLIDIRNSTDYSIKHIESSINLPLSDLTKSLAKIDKTKRIQAS